MRRLIVLLPAIAALILWASSPTAAQALDSTWILDSTQIYRSLHVDSTKLYTSSGALDSTRSYSSTRVDSSRFWYTEYSIPFGSYDCTAATLRPFTLCVRPAGSWSASDMKGVAALGGKLILSQGGYDKFRACAPTCTLTSTNRQFSPTNYYNWVQTLKPYVAAWQPYLTNGTLRGAQVIDDRTASNWGGVALTNAQIDQMAKAWKQVLPGVATFVGGGYTWNLVGYTYSYLDGSINQYAARLGDAKTWADKSVAAAAAAHTSLILSINVLKGGKIVTGCYHGYNSTTCSMSPTEIRLYGAVIASEPGICGISSWKMAPAYQAQPGVMDALKYVAALAAARPTVSCRVR